MIIKDIIFSFCGGLALFLFGMNFMSDGLKNIGSNKFKEILNSLTKNKFRSILIGMGITCLIQSSSATSVMVVGFVNAGLLSLSQAIAVVLGADIGTTFTAWLVSVMGKFKMSHYALPVIAVGFLINFTGRKYKTRMIGQCLLGFGLLFMGLGTMSSGLTPLKESQYVKDIFANFGANPFLGILAGVIVTMILQSSSVTIAIVQVMAFQGLINLDAALALLLGDNIGTTITAHLAAIGGTKNSRGVAIANSLFKVFGTVLFLPLLLTGLYQSFIMSIVPGKLAASNIMFHIAVAHSFFNVVNVLIFSVFLWPFLIKISESLMFGRQEIDREPQFLDPLLLAEPPIAMQQVILEMGRMAEIGRGTIQDAKNALFKKDMRSINSIREKEETLDQLQKSITAYLIQISERDLDTMESMEYPVLLHCVNDLEKIGDYAMNLADYAENSISNKYDLLGASIERIQAMFTKIDDMFSMVIDSLREKHSDAAIKAIEIEDEIDNMKLECRKNYIKRLNRHKAKPEVEMMLMDIATNIEKMGDHLTSIAKAVLNDLKWGKKVAIQPTNT